MGLKDLQIRDLDVFYNLDEGSVEVSYTPVGEEAVSIIGNVEYGENLEDSGSDPSTRASAFLWVKKEDIPDPQYRDTALIGEETWTVVRVIEWDDLESKLEIERDVRSTFKK